MKGLPGGRGSADADQVTGVTARAIAARHARRWAWVLISVGAGCILLGGLFFAANQAGHNVMAIVTHEGPCSNRTCTVHVSYYAGDREVSAVMDGVPRGEVYGSPWPRLNITYQSWDETDPTTNYMPDAIWIGLGAVGLACVGSGVWLRRRTGRQRMVTEAAVVTGMTPEHEAPYALHENVRRGELSAAAQLKDDRLKPAWEQEEARLTAAEQARHVIPSARWSRFAAATMILGVLTGFYGTIPAAVGLFNTDNVATAAHFSFIQDVIASAAFGLFVAGPSLTLYFTVRFAKRPSVMASTFGLTVFNWKKVTVPWHSITDVVLTPVTRFARRGWVPGIVQKDGRVVPVAFAAFLPSGRQAQGSAPQMPTSGEVFEVSALIRRGLAAHDQDTGSAAGTVSDQGAPEVDTGTDPFALPLSSGQPWTSDRLAISREWVAYKDVAGKVPWNVIPYAAISSLRPAPGGGIMIRQPDGHGVALAKKVLASPEAATLLAEGLGANTTVAPAAYELLQPYLDAARLKRDALAAARHGVDRSGTTHTLRVQRGLILASGIFVLAGSAACLGLAVAAPLTGWSPSVGNRRDEVWALILAVLCLWFGIRLLRVGVQVSGEKLTIRSYFRTRTVDASQIRAITLHPKVISQGGATWIPRVDLTDGTSIWITNFECGPAARPPRLDRVATVDELRKLLRLES